MYKLFLTSIQYLSLQKFDLFSCIVIRALRIRNILNKDCAKYSKFYINNSFLSSSYSWKQSFRLRRQRVVCNREKKFDLKTRQWARKHAVPEFRLTNFNSVKKHSLPVIWLFVISTDEKISLSVKLDTRNQRDKRIARAKSVKV